MQSPYEVGKNDFIDNLTYKRLLTTDGITLRAYGAPKIHKPGNPFRVYCFVDQQPVIQSFTLFT